VSDGLGRAAPLAFVVCGGLMALIVTSLAMAGSRITATGGIYAYVEAAFGPFAGFLAGVLMWLTGLLAVSGVAAALLDQAATLQPAIGHPVARTALLTGIVIALAAINTRGVTAGARVIETVAAFKLLPLLLFVAVGAFFVEPSAIAWPGMPETDAVGRAVLLLIFAYSGVEVALAPSGEVRAVSRTVPRALFLALAITTALYIAVQLVAQGVLAGSLADNAAAPLAEAAARFLGGAGRTLLLLGALCSMFGYLCGDMLSTPRTLYAIGRDGFLPPAIASVHPHHRTPHVAIWTHAVLVIACASASTFQQLAIISNVGLLLVYFLCCAAALELSRRDVRADGAPFAPRWAWLAPVAGAVAVLWILSTATWNELAVTAAVLAIAAMLYAWRRAIG
jgi:APA family basic amino acid/polyamine antiporter